MINELILIQDFLWENMVKNEQKKRIFEIESQYINLKKFKTASCLLMTLTQQFFIDFEKSNMKAHETIFF